MKARLLETPGAPPVVYAQIDTPGASRTITFYAHYDGQPLDPKEWVTPPWQPVVRDGQLDRDGKIVALNADMKIDPEWWIYAVGVRRQSPDHRYYHGSRCASRGADRFEIQHQIRVRRGRRSGIAESG